MGSRWWDVIGHLTNPTTHHNEFEDYPPPKSSSRCPKVVGLGVENLQAEERITITKLEFTRLRAAFGRLITADDPKTRIANLLALVLAWNTPFYPLYVLAAAGRPASPWTLLNLAVLPFFAAVPLVTRRHPLLGRALLVGAGTLNTILCTWLYGEPAGAQLFLLPCVTLAIMLFHRHERLVMVAMLALPIVAYAMLGHYGTPPHLYSATQYKHLLNLNAASVGTLTAFLAWTFAS